MADASGPTPGNGGGAQQEVLANLPAAVQLALSASGASASRSNSDPANVPLWMVRPSEPKRLTGGAGSANAAEHDVADLGNIASDIAGVGGYAGITTPATKSAAEAHWLDMSDSEKQAFAKAAADAGQWKPKDGAFSLAQAWTQAVDLAQRYNAGHDKSKWLSPFEAIRKLAPDMAASRGASYNGFSQTTKVDQFRESDLYAQAKQILQADLGRDPTAAELHAFTLAANAAAEKNPQITTTQQANPDGTGNNQVVVYGQGSFDPTQTIDQMVKNTDEYAKYQAAVDYFPAVMQALGAVV